MGLFDRVEARLERAVNGVFARAFKDAVQPVEIASAIRGAMDDRAAVVGKGRSFVPNVYSIELSTSDYEHLEGYEEDLSAELIASAAEHAEQNYYHPAGDFHIELREVAELKTGVFRVRPATAKNAGMTAAHGHAGAPDGHDGAQRAQDAGRHEGLAGPNAADDVDVWVDVANDAVTNDALANDALTNEAVPDGADAGQPSDGPQATAPANHPPNQHPAKPAHSPKAPRRPRSRISERPWLDIGGDRYPLLGPITVLGRDDDADIILDDPGISRRHSELRVTTDGPHLVTTLRDLGSTNGTFCNGERISSLRLSDRDEITVGRTRLVYRAGRA